MRPRDLWKMMNDGPMGYLFYTLLGVVAALVFTTALGGALNTSIPLVAVVSGSMDHGANEDGPPCGKELAGYTESFDNWWTLCDFTYDDFGVTKEQFSSFPQPNGLKKGDIAVIVNDGEFSVGDIIVYNIPGQGVPIIHRIVAESGKAFQTKGDHNPGQNFYEASVGRGQIQGKVVLVVPYLGYLRVLLPIN